MNIWTFWTDGLADVLGFLSADGGLSPALAILVLTLMLRLAIMPLSVAAALRADRIRRRLDALKPELDGLRARLHGDRQALAAQTMALYRQHGIRFLDRVTLANLAGQTAFGLGMFRMLRKAKLGGGFLWIADIARPDLLLALVSGALMTLAMSLAPAAQSPMSPLILIIPLAISIISIASLPSAIGLYWAGSNLASLSQTLLVRRIIARRS